MNTSDPYVFGEIPKLAQKRDYPFLFYTVPLIILISIIFYPLIYSLANSFRLYNFIHPEWGHPFIGFQNFSSVLFDSEFFHALKITLSYTVFVIGAELILAVFLAGLLSRVNRGTSILIFLLLLPMVMAPAVAGVIWRWMYHPQLGVINYVLSAIGVNEINWTGGRNALLSLMIIDLWQWTPFVFLIVYAGLVSLPREPFEAAQVDGMSKWQEFRYMTIPLMLPSVLIAALLRLIYAIQVFEYPFIITGGGPGRQTETLNFYLYRLLFEDNDVGKSAAGSFLFLIVVIIISQIIIVNLLRSERWRT